MNLFTYQRQGVDRLFKAITRHRVAYLADEQGLGKTAQALTLAKRLNAKKILIICPATLRLNWIKEMGLWYSEIENKAFPVFTGKELEKAKQFPVQVVSFNLASSKSFKPSSYDMVIVDEAHAYKNTSAQRTKTFFQKIKPRARYTLLCSGTPITNLCSDIYPALNCVFPMRFSTEQGFKERYCNKVADKWTYSGFKYEGINRDTIKELSDFMFKEFMIRRTKKQVLPELPDKTFQTIDLKIKAGDIKKAALPEDVVAEMVKQIEDGKMPRVAEHVAAARQELGVAKVPASLEYIETLLESDCGKEKQLVIFAHHKDVVRGIVEGLSDRNINVAAITGSTPPAERQAIVDRFQAGEVQCIIGNILAAGTGITLTAADTCVFIEQDWTPANMAQAIDRLHRIGQKENVHIIFLAARGTLDSRIIQVLRKKIADINTIMEQN